MTSNPVRKGKERKGVISAEPLVLKAAEKVPSDLEEIRVPFVLSSPSPSSFFLLEIRLHSLTRFSGSHCKRREQRAGLCEESFTRALMCLARKSQRCRGSIDKF